MFYEYKGNIHIHTTYSDGTGSIEDVVKAGQRAGLDYVIITDHNTLQGLREGKEGWYDNILVVIGVELNTDNHHYLALGIKKEIEDFSQTPQKTIDEVNKQGGLGFIAHPFEKGSKLVFGGRAFTWNDWNVKGFTGLSIWNYCSSWRDAITSIPKALYKYYIDRNGGLGPDPLALKKWDELNAVRRTVGIGASDAHAFQTRYGFLKATIFPYEYLFKTVNTHLLLPEPLKGDLYRDKALVYRALKKGSCFVGFDLYHDSRGFRFWAAKGQQNYNMGDCVDISSDTVLKVKLPRMGIIKLIKNGKTLIKKKTVSLKHKPETRGFYRVEAYTKGFTGRCFPWIFSNPIYVV